MPLLLLYLFNDCPHTFDWEAIFSVPPPGLVSAGAGHLDCVRVQALKEEELVRLLTEPRGALCKQYNLQFDLNGAGFIMTEALLRTTSPCV